MELRSSLSTRPRSASDINRDSYAESLPPDASVLTMDEWRWEWLIPLAKHGARPESFEGAMGMVWYELEAKCLFRWDKIDENGQVISAGSTRSTLQATDSLQALNPSNLGGSKGQVKFGSIKLLKGLEATANTAKSIANALGKLRAGNRDRAESKGKKTLHSVGDFVLGTQHDEYMKESIEKAQQAAEAAAAAAKALTSGLGDDQKDVGGTTLLPEQKSNNPSGVDSAGETRSAALSQIPEHVPFLIRRVQIQVPSVIPIPGYAQTSFLVPSSKTGGLVSKVKRCDGAGDPGLLGTGTAFRDQYIGHHVSKDAKTNRPPNRLDPRYPDSFQVALTIRKVTPHDINRSDILRRRYENAEVAAKTVAKHTNTNNREEGGLQGVPRRRLLSGACMKSIQPNHGSTPQSETVLCEPNRTDAVACTTPNFKLDETCENAGKEYRREIRVRKIKCEFWQKESCRLPTDDAPSRSIKSQLAPAFIYSEKEQVKERVRDIAGYNQHAAHHRPVDSTAGVTSLPCSPQGLEIPTSGICDNGSISAPTTKCAAATSCSQTPYPLKPPPRMNAGERKGSFGSIFSTSLHRSACSSPAMRPTSVVPPPNYSTPSQARNHPFMLLIPVPLDSPKLRQTYNWPSSDMPSPIIPSPYDYTMPCSLISETGLGLASELDSMSQSITHDEGELASHGVCGYIPPTVPSTSTVKARIVVKHHLSFRLSIDVLEYEGEYEQEDTELEALEEQQLQREKDHQVMSLESDSGLTNNSDLRLRDLKGHSSTPEETKGFGRLKGGSREQHAPANDLWCASRESSLPLRLAGVNESDGNSSQRHIQPSPGFLEQEAGRLLQKSPLLGLACALPFHRRGSQGSLGTVGSSCSSSSGTATSASLLRVQACSNVVGTSDSGGAVLQPLADASNASGVGGDGGGSRGLMAETIGALKKKTSFSGLVSALGTTATSLATHHLQPQQQPSQASSSQTRVVARKLKDFVIRVPITVVIQVDEQGQAVGAYGTTETCGTVRCEEIVFGQNDATGTLLRPSYAPHAEIRANEDVTFSSTAQGLWPKQANDQRVLSLEQPDEEFGDDFIVVDAEEVDGDDFDAQLSV
ncbi:hypothetical protein EC968_008802 [Mortierella alpina]|nr:hypothetical protein EC968_008802 [Mortierella alpina]